MKLRTQIQSIFLILSLLLLPQGLFYLKKVRNTYEVQRPVSGRRASDCVSPSIAALTWELPCYNPDQMPHRKGLVLSYLDGHSARVPGNANEHSWWAYHSRDGCEEAEYTCGNRH